jgi:RNA polymerase sigma factor (sigma-70 family)
LLAVPTKKIAPRGRASSPDDGALRRALAAVLREDLGLAGERPGWERRLRPARLDLCSPTRGVPTTYTVWPVLVPVDHTRQDALRYRLCGEWLTYREALQHPDLSPTARAALEGAGPCSLDQVPAGKRAGRPGLSPADDWTARLLDARAGDLNAFGQLFEEMKPWLVTRLRTCGYTRALFQVPDEVEDALHDAAVSALGNLKAFEPDRGSAATWLWVVTRNSAVTLLRRRGGRRVLSLSPWANRSWPDVPDDRQDPAVLAEEREALEIARRHLNLALDRCNPEVRRTWELRYLHGKRYAEIAADLGRSPGTIATWLHRVKMAARELAALSGTERFRTGGL